jgi:hypothetical protein
MSISLEGLNKPEVFAALYNNAKTQGMGIFKYIPEEMTPEEAKDNFGECSESYDYVNGRVMKVDLSGDSLDPRLYDRDNGNGAASQIICELRNQS